MADTKVRPVEVVRNLYECFEARDVEGALALLDPEVSLTQDASLPWGGTFHGIDGVIEFYGALLGAIDSAVTQLALFEAGDTVVQYGRTAGTVIETGAAFDLPETHVWTVRDGKVVEGRMYVDTPAMLDALGGADSSATN